VTDFGEAIRALKTGHRVHRAGWNGKGMWLVYIRTATAWGLGSAYETLPFIAMRTAQGEFVPWLASQTDMLAEDWHVIRDTGAQTPAS
jgi:hypothetical protein